MLNVDTATKNAYLSDSTHKIIRVVFPELGLEYTNDNLVSQSLEYKESLSEGNIEFVGCIASEFSITIRNLSNEVKGKRVNVYISIPNTTEIPLFMGYVYEVELAAEKRHKKIKAYDALYNLSQTDVARWYTELSFPLTLKDLRDSLFLYLGINQVAAALPNDEVSVVRQYNPTVLSALDVIKSLCQINGVFGRMNRYANFEYLYPASGSGQNISFYKAASYQEFSVKPADKVVVVYGDTEGAYGGGNNIYTVQNNIFTSGLDSSVLQSIAENIYNNVNEFSYIPFNCDVNGIPFLECLDTLTMNVADLETSEMQQKTFVVLSRTISGIQSLRDKCYAEGDEYQHIFTSDIGTKIEELRRQMEVIRSDMDNLKFAYYLITTDEDITIHDGEEKTIIDMYFSAKEKSVVTFNCEILLTAETTAIGNDFYDAIGKVTYFVNSNEIIGYNPTETWQDGEHILHLYYFINVQDAGTRRFQVKMELNGGTVIIRAADLKGAIYGQNLAGTEEWNGIIQVDERVSGFNLIETDFINIDDFASVWFPRVLSIIHSDLFTSYNLNEISIESELESVTVISRVNSKSIITETGENITTEEGLIIYTEGE